MHGRTGPKTVLITGCTPGGIGHALCLEFHKQGLHVIASARKPSVLDELVDLGLNIVQLDVSDPNSIAACHKRVQILTGGKLDILVNNAGRTHTHPALDISLPDVRETFETNVFGPMAMVSAFSDMLVAAQGLVINVASLAAVVPYVFGSVYCASKGAVVSYSRTLRLELRPLGVRVMVVMAGTVASNIASQGHRSLPPGSWYESVQDIFERRLVFSQTDSTVSTESFAERVVAAAVRGETPEFLRGWLGRPDWLWTGGLANLVWLGTWIGEWVIDLVCWRKFELYKMPMPVREPPIEMKMEWN
ncbi:hypothetical protein E8E14_011187 [Neopestalotiopsis sp. 37M]|nr:hypothetical protein E8E14_011187 [Neopestalotiopsis sp. 37M]